MPQILRIPHLVEGAVDLLVERLQQELPNALLAVAQFHAPGGESDGVDTPPPDPDRYLISELLEPVRVPSVFVIPRNTDHDLERGQNFFDQDHDTLIGVVMDNAQSIQILQRQVWRYAQALVIALHDANIGPLHVLVRSVAYSPTLNIRNGAGDRVFRKDCTLRCRVMHLEAFN